MGKIFGSIHIDKDCKKELDKFKFKLETKIGKTLTYNEIIKIFLEQNRLINNLNNLSELLNEKKGLL